jgi:hypothetical protein
MTLASSIVRLDGESLVASAVAVVELSKLGCIKEFVESTFEPTHVR